MTSGGQSIRWAQTQRLLFIRAFLIRTGKIGRIDIQCKFGVSTPQASIDLREAQAKWPELMKYDRSAKAYIVGKISDAEDIPPALKIEPDEIEQLALAHCSVWRATGSFEFTEEGIARFARAVVDRQWQENLLS